MMNSGKGEFEEEESIFVFGEVIPVFLGGNEISFPSSFFFFSFFQINLKVFVTLTNF